MRCCYEAGPTGFGLYRAAGAAGVECHVIAPSKTPRAAGERHKSDRRDAELLLRQLMAGALTPVAVPSATFEAARDLARAHEQIRADLMRCRHRVSPGRGGARFGDGGADAVVLWRSLEHRLLQLQPGAGV